MQDNILPLIGRTAPLFETDISVNEAYLSETIRNSRFLVIGGAGTIGSAICRELFARNPKVLHVVDISENNMVELVRDIRSSVGYGDGEFATFALDCGSEIFRAFINEQKKRIGGYDYVFNTSALKHVRSEKDPFTLMRMIDTNIFNTEQIQKLKRQLYLTDPEIISKYVKEFENSNFSTKFIKCLRDHIQHNGISTNISLGSIEKTDSEHSTRFLFFYNTLYLDILQCKKDSKMEKLLKKFTYRKDKIENL